jgi:hypothetical protein
MASTYLQYRNSYDVDDNTVNREHANVTRDTCLFFLLLVFISLAGAKIINQTWKKQLDTAGECARMKKDASFSANISKLSTNSGIYKY